MSEERSDESNHAPRSWFVYIAELMDGTYYVGMTGRDPRLRAARHRAGAGSLFVLSRGMRRLVWMERHETSRGARRREVQLKKWSRAKKAALIAGDLEALRRLARSPKRLKA